MGTGQANYAYANAVAEEVAASRKRDGLPGLHVAIQWGPVDDVGFVARASKVPSLLSPLALMYSSSSLFIFKTYYFNFYYFITFITLTFNSL